MEVEVMVTGVNGGTNRGKWVLNKLEMQTGHCNAILEHYSSFP